MVDVNLFLPKANLIPVFCIPSLPVSSGTATDCRPSFPFTAKALEQGFISFIPLVVWHPFHSHRSTHSPSFRLCYHSKVAHIQYQCAVKWPSSLLQSGICQKNYTSFSFPVGSAVAASATPWRHNSCTFLSVLPLHLVSQGLIPPLALLNQPSACKSRSFKVCFWGTWPERVATRNGPMKSIPKWDPGGVFVTDWLAVRTLSQVAQSPRRAATVQLQLPQIHREGRDTGWWATSGIWEVREKE